MARARTAHFACFYFIRLELWTLTRLISISGAWGNDKTAPLIAAGDVQMHVNRRELLTALTLLGAGPIHGRAMNVSAGAETRPPAVTGTSDALARNACEAAFDALSADTVRMTKRSILDAIGVSLAATGLEPSCRPFVDLVLEQGGAKESSLFGSDHRVPASAAAMANGALAHALDYEDVHDASDMHPNAAVVPVALALAQANPKISGKDLIVAVAVGCDLACRLGLARNHDFNSFGWYFPPIASAFGATATAGRLLGLDPRQMLSAFSLTLCQSSCSSELLNNPGTAVRAIRDAFPAQTAIMSAKLARAGVRGFDLPFEGKNGFATMYAHGEMRFDPLVEQLGTYFHGVDVSYKLWPACRGSHPYIQAALSVAESKTLRVQDIQQIIAVVRPLDEILCVPTASKAAPSTAIDAKFSIPFTVATALVRGNVVLASFSDRARADPEILAVARKVTHVVDPVQVKAGGPLLIIGDDAGRHYEESVTALLGSPGKPVSDEVIVNKFLECAGHATKPMSGTDARRLAAKVWKLEQLPQARSLLNG